MSKLTKKEARIRRHRRLRHKISGTAQRPRLAVCRTARHVYAQVIDDEAHCTLVAASTLRSGQDEKNTYATCETAAEVGRDIAAKALAAGIKEVVFDRGGFKYHGRIKALADAAREQGLTL